MRTTLATALLVLAVPRAGLALEWTKGDTALEAAFAAAAVLDWRQTDWALANGRQEMNPLIGRNPSRAQLRATILVGMAAHGLVSAALPQPYRRWWQGVTLAGELGAVGYNASVGARFTF